MTTVREACPTNMETNDRVRVGLVGAGYVSAYHARALRSLPFVEIVAIADPDAARAEQVAARFGIPRVYASLEAMAEARPEAIHVLTPPATHAALVLQALDMGCHVFVEKPLAETVADCDRMIARAREKGLILSVNHSARMDPIVLRALELLRNGACGDVTGADFFRSSDYPAYAGGPVMPPHFRNGSYPFQDLGVHGLYLLEAFLGPIRRAAIRYYASDLGDPNLVYDEWRALVECQNGTGHMYLSWNVRPMQNEITVHGTRGVMLVDCYLQTLSIRKTYPAPKPVQRILSAGLNSLGMLWKVTANTIRFATKRLLPSPGIHVSVVKFHEALRKGEPPPVPAEEGRRIIALLEEVSLRADADKRRHLAESEPTRSATHPGDRRPWPSGAGPGAAPARIGRAVASALAAARPNGAQRRCATGLWRSRQPRGGRPRRSGRRGGVSRRRRHERRTVRISGRHGLGHAQHRGSVRAARRSPAGVRQLDDGSRSRGARAGVPANETSPYEPHPAAARPLHPDQAGGRKNGARRRRGNRMHAVVLRPGQIYGPGAEKVPPWGTISLAGRWLVVGSGDRHVPLVYVENVVDALAARGPGRTCPTAPFSNWWIPKVSGRRNILAGCAAPAGGYASGTSRPGSCYAPDGAWSFWGSC